MTPCQELGYEVGDRFVMKQTNDVFTAGDIIELYEDDHSFNPLFLAISNKDIAYTLAGGKPGAYVSLDKITPVGEYTGGSTDYYKLRIEHPTTAKHPYDVECNDIIEALDMNFAEGNVFKALWRRAAARKGKQKKGYVDGKYDAEKILFFAKRILEQEK